MPQYRTTQLVIVHDAEGKRTETAAGEPLPDYPEPVLRELKRQRAIRPAPAAVRAPAQHGTQKAIKPASQRKGANHG